MRYVWDHSKAASNKRKHGIDFSDAVLVLEEPLALAVLDVVGGEDRYVSIGMDGLGRLLVVVYAVRGHQLRLISVRPVDRIEQRQYEEMP
jgi:uncharacterized DUF497 family protein